MWGGCVQLVNRLAVKPRFTRLVSAVELVDFFFESRRVVLVRRHLRIAFGDSGMMILPLGILEQRASSLHVTVRAPATSVANLIEKQPRISS